MNFAALLRVALKKAGKHEVLAIALDLSPSVIRKKEELRATVGTSAARAVDYQTGTIYTDAQGRKAKYLGEGKWQLEQ